MSNFPIRLIVYFSKLAKKELTHKEQEETMRRDIASTIARACFKSNPRPGRCFRCEKLINEIVDFRDKKSFAEYRRSGLCQQCQDAIFFDKE